MATLNVYLYNQLIGTLTQLPSELTLFTFNDEYINDSQRPTLSLSFKDALHETLITEIRPTKVKLPPFFSNLLPEGFLREYLAGLSGVNAEREFYLLRALGRDLPGALTVKPEEGDIWPSEAFDNNEQQLKEQGLRFSLAGIQLKFSALMESSGGLTIPAKGIGGDWIVKLPSQRFSLVPENEYAMLSLAKMIGITVPDIQLVELNNIAGLPKNIGDVQGNALVIKRFDRGDSGAIHIEDFAQVFSLYPRDKYNKINYKNIAEVLWKETDPNNLIEFTKRLVFNILIGNADMHAKNWSLIYPERRQAQLAPAYDFVSTIVYLDDPNMALNLVKSKNMSEITSEHLSGLAAKVGIPNHLMIETAQQTIQHFHEKWQAEKSHLPLTQNMRSTIEKHIKSLALIRTMV